MQIVMYVMVHKDYDVFVVISEFIVAIFYNASRTIKKWRNLYIKNMFFKQNLSIKLMSKI